jgi:hypothetical protein
MEASATSTWGGEERDIMAAYGAVLAAIEGVSGRELSGGRSD